jgi:hypothetical protein
MAVSRKVLPGWVLAVFAATLLLPALVASIDALARARRRREVAPGWWGTLALWTLPFLAAFAMAELLVLVGQAPDAGAAPSEPGVHPFDGQAGAALGACLATAVLVGLLVRPSLKRRFRVAGYGGAGAVTALALSVAALAVWAMNPFAALLLVPAVHLWMLAMLSGFRLRRGGAALLVLAGVLPPLLAAIVYLDRLALDPLEGVWYAWVLATGHAISPLTTLLACVCWGIAAAAMGVMAARIGAPPPLEPEAPRVRGPGGYAGPGSLGGTPSTLSRR